MRTVWAFEELIHSRADVHSFGRSFFPVLCALLMYMFHQIYPAYHDAHLRFISTSIDLVKDAHALGQLAVTINIYIILLSDIFSFFSHSDIEHTNLLFLDIQPYLNSRTTIANAKIYINSKLFTPLASLTMLREGNLYLDH